MPDSILLRYSQNNTEEVESIILELERHIGAKRYPYFSRAGSTDLVTIMEICKYIAPYIIIPLIGEYVKGFFGADKLRALGESNKRKIIKELGKEWEDIKVLSDGIRKSLKPVQKLLERKEAISLVVSFDAFHASFVLNPVCRCPEMFKTLPIAILDFLLLCVSGVMPKDAEIIQFWYDPDSHYWRYIFIPTRTKRFIDRFIDLNDSCEYRLDTPEEFIARFNISKADEWRFLFNPFAEQWPT